MNHTLIRSTLLEGKLLKRKLRKGSVLSGALAVAVLLSSQAVSHGATILNFGAFPVSPGTPEITFSNPGTGLALQAGPGAVGNGDGGLASASQTSGGLLINTPLTIIDPTTLYGRQNNSDGSTAFYDVTLVLTGLTPDSNAMTLGPLVYQGLTGGTFAFYGSKMGGGQGQLLLGGTLANTSTNGINGSGTGATLSNQVTYTGGAIYNALVAAGGVTTGAGNELSFSLTDISPVLGVTGGHLSPFTANATGLFSTPRIPEPASLLTTAIAGFYLLRRRQPQ